METELGMLKVIWYTLLLINTAVWALVWRGK